MYRMHFEGNTGRHVRTGEDISYTRKAIDIFEDYLPQSIARRVTHSARETYALSALAMARTLAARRDLVGMFSQIRAALGCCRSRKVIWQAARLSSRAIAGSLKPANG
jgi:hypothetical protein